LRPAGEIGPKAPVLEAPYEIKAESFAEVEVFAERHRRDKIEAIESFSALVDPLEDPANGRQLLIDYPDHRKRVSPERAVA